jgi:hypothetical protein
MSADRENQFTPGKQSQQAKAAATDNAARAIVSAETAARLKKTVRLRELRLQQAQSTIDTDIQQPKSKKKRPK